MQSCIIYLSKLVDFKMATEDMKKFAEKRYFKKGKEVLKANYRAIDEAINYMHQNKLPVKSNPARNRIVLFESPLQQDAGAPPLFLSRCIGMPGDTMLVSADGYSVNGREIPLPPEALAGYFVTYKPAPALLAAMRHLQLSTRNWSGEISDYQWALTPF